jgi:hypothetical protein
MLAEVVGPIHIESPAGTLPRVDVKTIISVPLPPEGAGPARPQAIGFSNGNLRSESHGWVHRWIDSRAP